MCWQCDNPESTTEDYLASLRTTVTQHRWAIQYVEGDRPFGYTIGLHPKGLPELLITGLPPNTSARLINSIAHQMVDDGVTLRPGTHIDYQGEFFLEVVEVDQPRRPSGVRRRAVRGGSPRRSAGVDRRLPPMAVGSRMEQPRAPATGARRPQSCPEMTAAPFAPTAAADMNRTT
jgi:hypothetical protein